MDYITEGSPLSFFTDLIAKIKGAKEKATAERRADAAKKNYIRGSISEYTKDLIMTFPTMVDNSLPPETASMISKATERNVVSMLRMLFASMQIKGSDGAEIISRIHKNINSALSLDDYIDIFDDMSALKNLKEAGKISYNERYYTKILQEAWKAKNGREKRFPINSFNERSLSGYMVKRDNIMKRVSVHEVSEEYLKPLLEARNNNRIDYRDANLAADSIEYQQKASDLELSTRKIEDYDDDRLNDIQYRNDDLRIKTRQATTAEERLQDERRKFEYQQDLDKKKLDLDYSRHELSKDEYELRKKELKNRQDEFEKSFNLQQKQYELQKKKLEAELKRQQTDDKYRIQQYKDQHRAAGVDFLSKQLLDQDVKKVNELTPTLLTVSYNTLDTDGKLYDERTFIAGVKSRLISVDPADIIERLIAKNKTKVSFLNFIRATTGEISFVKDFLFCTKQAKIDAKNSVKKGPAAKLWKVLENRSVKNNWHKLNRNGNDASSITTLVINQETVNMMKKEFDFNLENIRNTRMIMDAYNLLAIVICDESIEVAKFFYAGNSEFEQQAYSSLEKESRDNSYKKVINLIGQMNGR